MTNDLSYESGADSLLDLFAEAGLAATVVFDGPEGGCPHCRPVLAAAA